MESLTIGEVAKQAHVRIETLRYYERTGLVAHPPRSASNYRLYPHETVRRVQCIKRAQELGFSLKDITALLVLRSTPETPCADIRQRAFDKITTIEEKIRTLNAMKHALAKLIEACSGQGEITDCPILAALDTEEKVHNGKVQRWQRNERLRFSVRDALPVKRLSRSSTGSRVPHAMWRFWICTILK